MPRRNGKEAQVGMALETKSADVKRPGPKGLEARLQELEKEVLRLKRDVELARLEKKC